MLIVMHKGKGAVPSKKEVGAVVGQGDQDSSKRGLGTMKINLTIIPRVCV